MLSEALARCGLVAILRGVRPDEAQAIGAALYAAGLRVVEVPLNSPDPLTSIRLLREALPPDCAVGAGTVLAPAQVEPARRAGAELVILPHCDAGVIRAAKAAGMVAIPGVATPTEAFAALAAGADLLKAFPAEQILPLVIRAWRAVLPPGTGVLPVGGITPELLAPYVAAGVAGFGLGSALYRPGATPAEVGVRAASFVAAWRTAVGRG